MLIILGFKWIRIGNHSCVVSGTEQKKSTSLSSMDVVKSDLKINFICT
jgi:hypothetical protein